MYSVDNKLVEIQQRFKEYYKSDLKYKYAFLEPQREIYLNDFKKRLKKCFYGFICLSVIVFILIKYFFDLDLFFRIYFFCIVYAVWFCSKPILEFKKATKALVMEQVLSFWGDFKCYKDKELFSYEYIRKSALFCFFNRQKQDDAFEGMYHDVKIKVSELELIQTKKLYEDEEKFDFDDDDRTIFNGVLIALQLNKKYKGKTIVCEKNSGKWVDLSKKEKDCQVFLEDVVFDKKWDVFADDQIEARYVLTPAMMERMLLLKKLFHGKRIEFSFWDNNLLIAVHTYEDMFETTSLFKSTLNYQKVQEVICQMYSVFSVIDVLKLRVNKNKKENF